MAVKKRKAKAKKYFTAEEANAALPLVRAIVRDIADLAQKLRERHERLARSKANEKLGLGPSYDEENQQATQETDRDHERFEECVRELLGLGIELKDPFTGLIDFPSRMDGREVYLCWRMGEPEVAYWHEQQAGFAGRQKLVAQSTSESVNQ